MRTSRMIRSLPLPAGGHSRYLTTLRECLGWLDATEGTTIETMEVWMQQQYGVKQSTANIYVRILAVLDLMRKRSQEIEITRWGQILLNASEVVVRESLTVLLMKKYEGFQVTLHLIAASPMPLTLEQIAQRCDLFSSGSLSVPRERILWQRALGLIEAVDYSETYRATVLGEKVADEVGSTEHHPLSEGAWLVERLEAASTDSQNSDDFEAIVEHAFEFLGFDAKHIGGRGNTDVLVTANYKGFRGIVDAKSRSEEYRLNAFDTDAINEHREKHKAPLAIIVAPEFGGGRVIRQADAHQIALVPVRILSQWLLWHEETTFSIAENIIMFEQVGLVDKMPEIFTIRRVYQQSMIKLLLSLFRLLEDAETSQLGIAWTADSSLHGALVIQSGEAFTQYQMQQALDLLQHPTVQAIEIDVNGVLHTTMTWQTFLARLSNLTQMLRDSTVQISK